MQKIYGVEIPEGIEISGYEDLFKWRKPEKDPAKYLDILPSEKAKAYKMRYDAMKTQGKKGSGLKLEALAKECEESRAKIQRYISITRLIDPLLNRVDIGKIKISQAVLLSDLKRKEQETLELILLETPCSISIAQAKEIKQLSQDRLFTKEAVLAVLDPSVDEKKTGEENAGRRVIFTEQTLKRFFPDYIQEEDIKKIMLDLLIEWKKSTLTSAQVE